MLQLNPQCMQDENSVVDFTRHKQWMSNIAFFTSLNDKDVVIECFAINLWGIRENWIILVMNLKASLWMPHKWCRFEMPLLNPCCECMTSSIFYFVKCISYCRLLISHPFKPNEWVLIRLKFNFRFGEHLPVSVISCVRCSHQLFKVCFPGGCEICPRSSDLLGVCSLLR